MAAQSSRKKQPKRTQRTPVKAALIARAQANASLPPEQKSLGGRPSKLEGTRGYHFMDRILTVVQLGAGKKLAARAGPCAYSTLKEWLDSGEMEREAMTEEQREALERAAELYLASTKAGGTTMPMKSLPDSEFSRHAKFSALYDQAAAQWLASNLANINSAAASGSYMASVILMERNYREEFAPAKQSQEVSGPDGGPVQVSQTVRVIEVGIPVNGWEPGGVNYEPGEGPAILPPPTGRAD